RVLVDRVGLGARPGACLDGHLQGVGPRQIGPADEADRDDGQEQRELDQRLADLVPNESGDGAVHGFTEPNERVVPRSGSPVSPLVPRTRRRLSIGPFANATCVPSADRWSWLLRRARSGAGQTKGPPIGG